MAETPSENDFPCLLTITVPLPSERLALSALRALEVDAELSRLVRRSFSLEPSVSADGSKTTAGEATVLSISYRATTNRMLRVAVNGFMESLGLVLAVMEELDVEVQGS